MSLRINIQQSRWRTKGKYSSRIVTLGLLEFTEFKVSELTQGLWMTEKDYLGDVMVISLEDFGFKCK